MVINDTVKHPDTPRNRGDDDAPHLTPAHTKQQRTILLNEIAWGAVLAGVVVALVTRFCSTCWAWELGSPH